MYTVQQRPVPAFTQRRGTNQAMTGSAWNQIQFATSITSGGGVTVLGGGNNDHFELTTPGWWYVESLIQYNAGFLLNIHDSDTASPGGLFLAYNTYSGTIAGVGSGHAGSYVYSNGTQKITVSVYASAAGNLSTSATNQTPRIGFALIRPDKI